MKRVYYCTDCVNRYDPYMCNAGCSNYNLKYINYKKLSSKEHLIPLYMIKKVNF